jgi:hypothetical protein
MAVSAPDGMRFVEELERIKWRWTACRIRSNVCLVHYHPCVVKGESLLVSVTLDVTASTGARNVYIGIEDSSKKASSCMNLHASFHYPRHGQFVSIPGRSISQPYTYHIAYDFRGKHNVCCPSIDTGVITHLDDVTRDARREVARLSHVVVHLVSSVLNKTY